MEDSLTLGSRPVRRLASFTNGAGMIIASALTIEHFYSANFPESIWQGSICDLNSFFNCDSSAFSSIAQIGGVPMGFFGLMVGALVCLGAVFPSLPFERTNQSIALLNALGVIALFFYSVAWLGSLCLLCSVYYLFSLLSLFLFWRFGVDRQGSRLARFARPSIKHVAAAAVVTAVGAYGFAAYQVAKQEGQSGAVAARVVEHR